MTHLTKILPLLVIVVAGALALPGHALALSNVNRVETSASTCRGTYIKDLTSTDGTFDGISTGQLPSDYATVTAYCIQDSRSTDCDSGVASHTFSLYSTYAKGTYTSSRACYLPDVDTATSPPRTNNFTLVYAQPSAGLTASSNTVSPNTPTQLTWSSTSATTCTGTGFSTGGQISGSVSVSPSATTQYTVTCTYGTATATANTTITVVQPSPLSASCSVNPTTATTDQNVTWTASVSGGTAPYTYVWSGDNLFDAIQQTVQTTYAYSGVKSGAVTVTDSGTSQSSSQTVTTVDDPNCTGTATGYGGSDMEDGSTPQHLLTFVMNIAKNAYLLLPDAIAHPQNYCVTYSSASNCPANGSGACITSLSWDLYLKNNSTPAPIYIPPTVTSVNGDNCTGAPNGACLQGNGGAYTWTVSNSGSPSGQPSSITVQCSNTVTVTGPVVAACKDGTDNNGNGLIDIQDSGCHTDGNPGGAPSYNSITYNPNATDESATPNPPPDNNNNNNSPASAVLSISANPTYIVNGSSTAVTWSASNVKSCSVSGTNGDAWSGTTGTRTSRALTHATTYTLLCTDLSDAQVAKSIKVRVRGTVKEE